jgi:hypothetical protein
VALLPFVWGARRSFTTAMPVISCSPGVYLNQWRPPLCVVPRMDSASDFDRKSQAFLLSAAVCGVLPGARQAEPAAAISQSSRLKLLAELSHYETRWREAVKSSDIASRARFRSAARGQFKKPDSDPAYFLTKLRHGCSRHWQLPSSAWKPLSSRRAL